MSVAAWPRRLSGSLRSRALAVTTPSSQPLGLIASNTLPSLDDALPRDALEALIAETDDATDAFGSKDASTLPTTAGTRKSAAFSALGRPPPAHRPLRDDGTYYVTNLRHERLARASAENIAENTFRRHPSAGPPWRAAGLGLRLSTSMNALAANPKTNPAQALVSLHGGLIQSTSTPESLLLLGLSEFEPQAQAQASVQVQTQAQAQTQTQARAYAQTPRAVSLTVLPPISLGSPADTHPTLEPCVPLRINPVKASREPSLAAAYSSVSVPPMPSATSCRPCTATRSQSSMKSSMPPPSSLSLAPSYASLAPPEHGRTSPVLSPVLPYLPSPSVFHPSLHSPGTLAPPPSPLHPSAFVPESPIAHSRRAPSPARTPPMQLHSTATQHTLEVHLPEGLSPEMVTISAKKGARLAVVADLWHRENDSHYEWEVAFSPADVDMNSVRAVFEANGQLMIHVQRRVGWDGLPAPLICTQ